MQTWNAEQVNRNLAHNPGGGTCRNFGRQACSSHLKLGKVLFLGMFKIFVSFGQVVQTSRHLAGGGGGGEEVDKVRPILGSFNFCI